MSPSHVADRLSLKTLIISEADGGPSLNISDLQSVFFLV